MHMADKFPEAMPGFQKMFLDDAACARYLEAIQLERLRLPALRRDGRAVPVRLPARHVRGPIAAPTRAHPVTGLTNAWT